MKPTKVCMVCKAVLEPGDPGAPISHGIGPCCWDAYRAAHGLKARPYPAYPVVIV